MAEIRSGTRRARPGRRHERAVCSCLSPIWL